MFENHTDEELITQITNLVRSKFTPPYLDEANRKAIDGIILDIWKELQSRKSS